jgi:hypothetical protein
MIAKKSVISVFVLVFIHFLTGCDDENKDIENHPENASEYLYVLNSGSMGMNNASLTMYNVEKRTVIHHYFEKQNNRSLGDTGQDILVYGSKIYISMTDERTVEITDLEAKSIKQIKTDAQPRSFAAHNGKVYITLFNGYVARLDTASMNMEEEVKVGRNPEQIAVFDDRLYVTNSGGLDFATETGYDKTVSVIDVRSFTEIKKIDVVINPCDIVSDNRGNIYVVSTGNYGDIPNTLQRIDAKTDQVSVMTDIKATRLALAGNMLYSLHAQWGNPVTCYSYDILNNAVLSINFTGNTAMSDAISISSDSGSSEVYIGTSDYMNMGDVYVFNKNGDLLYDFEAGLNPVKTVKIKK